MSAPQTRPPMVGGAVWLPVMEAAGFRCQCAGACGCPHVKSGGRCPREHNDAPGGRRLTAAPADPALSPTLAAGLPAEKLQAWCPGCLDGARTAARRTANTGLPQEEDLFGGTA